MQLPNVHPVQWLCQKASNNLMHHHSPKKTSCGASALIGLPRADNLAETVCVSLFRGAIDPTAIACISPRSLHC